MKSSGSRGVLLSQIYFSRGHTSIVGIPLIGPAASTQRAGPQPVGWRCACASLAKKNQDEPKQPLKGCRTHQGRFESPLTIKSIKAMRPLSHHQKAQINQRVTLRTRYLLGRHFKDTNKRKTDEEHMDSMRGACEYTVLPLHCR